MPDSDTNLLCRKAESYYYDFLGGEGCDPVPEFIVGHIGSCRFCNQQLDRLKKTLSQNEDSDPQQKQNRADVNETLQRHFAYIGQAVTCNTVKPFLPALLAKTIRLAVPTPITVHIDNCRQCREDLETLRTAESISQRPQSEVATIYSIDKTAAQSPGLYAGFPIKVEVTHRSEQPEVAQPAKFSEFASAAKSRLYAVKLKPLLKTAVAAAALILITSALFINTSTAGAVSLRQVYKAIEKIKNVYIASFAIDENVYIAGFPPDQTEPVQQIWLSKTLNIYMTKTGNEYVLNDIGGGIRKTKNPVTGEAAEGLLTGQTAAGIEKIMSGSLGLMPFYSISQVPADAQWNRITDESMEAAAEGLEVYELKWTKETYDGSGVFHKCRFFVDPQTNLLRKVEVYQQMTPDSQCILMIVKLIEYPDENEIRGVIGEVSL